MLAACSGPTASTQTGDPADPDDSLDSAGPAAPIDADRDGVAAPDDCDDTDPTISPDADEICDGIDQDCDGVIDDGVPGDGAGCRDPGLPVFPETVGVVHITARTGTDTFNGTNGSNTACLGTGRCMSLDKVDWDDHERGIVDVQVAEGVGWSRADLMGLTVSVDSGTDQWRPTCMSVRLDGEPVGCWGGLDVALGSEGAESPSWTSGGWGGDCDTCFDATLTHGPLLGATTPTSARIWYRTDATRRVVVRVAETEAALADARPTATRYPSADRDFTDEVHIVGLTPETTWRYDLEVDGQRFGPYRFTTAPPLDGGTRLDFAFGSCAKTDEQAIFGVLSASDPELFVFIGDNHYGNTGDLASLRQFYRHARERPLRAEFVSSRSVLATWDDHDYTGNNTDGSAPDKDVALRVFEEYWANGSYGLPDVPGVFSQHRWGDVALFLLDDRYWRGLDDSILGDAQETWLLDALDASTATFKLLASGSQWTQEGSGDSWAAFPAAQDRLRAALVEREIDGVVLLSGDIHRSELRLLPGAAGGYDLPELTSSPLANTNSLCRDDGELRACLDDGVSFVHVSVDTTLDDPSLTARVIDGDSATRATWTLHASELQVSAGR